MTEPIKQFIQEASGEGHRTRLANVAKEQMEAAMTRELELLKRERKERARRLGLGFPALTISTTPAHFAPHMEAAHEATLHVHDLRLGHDDCIDAGFSEADKERHDADV